MHRACRLEVPLATRFNSIHRSKRQHFIEFSVGFEFEPGIGGKHLPVDAGNILTFREPSQLPVPRLRLRRVDDSNAPSGLERQDTSSSVGLRSQAAFAASSVCDRIAFA
jgi:hypothetical protein